MTGSYMSYMSDMSYRSEVRYMSNVIFTNRNRWSNSILEWSIMEYDKQKHIQSRRECWYRYR